MNWNYQSKWFDVVQNSDEWFNMRLGLSTSSNFDKICANMGKSFGNPALEYAQKKALERVTFLRDENGYRNAYMDRGNELEPVACDLYEKETFNEVTNGGFSKCGKYGDSMDGVVGSDGCIEIKCVIPNTQWKRIKSDKYDTSYKWQIQGHLLISNKKWCDFVSYCPEFPENKRLFIKRVFIDEEMQKQLKERLIEFESKILDFVKMIS